MPVKITWLPMNKTVEVDLDAMPYKEHGKPHSFLDVAKNCGVGLEHACGGNCACTTCHVVIKKGEEMLSPMEDDEADRLDMAADLTLHSRLGCQAVIEKNEGEIVVEIPSWNRNYVSEGGETIFAGAKKEEER
jgi:2Fe-2S ferredoxin